MDDIKTFIRLQYGRPTDPTYINRIPEKIIVAAYRTMFRNANGYDSVRTNDDIIETVRHSFDYPNSDLISVEEYSEAFERELIRLHQND